MPLSNFIPDSEICQKATQLVAAVSPTFLCNHCLRTFLFGDLLGQRDGLKCDRELLYLGAVMHDLGLTDRFDGEQRFEVDGADAARAFILEHGLPDEKAEIVWDAIALHTSLGIASRKQPEIALVCLGASADVLGERIADIPPETVEQVIDVYPRLCFNTLTTLPRTGFGCGDRLLSRFFASRCRIRKTKRKITTLKTA